MLYLRPFQGGEGEKARAEPGIEYILILLDYNLLSRQV